MESRTKMMLGGAAAVLGLLAGVFLFSRSPAPEAPVASAPVSAAPSVRASPSPPPVAPASAVGTAPVATEEPPAGTEELSGDPEQDLDKLAAAVRSRYGTRLHEPYIQVKLLEELMRYFQKRSPDRWQEELLAFLKKAFPERYEELATMLRNRVDYEKWVKDNDAYLRGLNDRERRAAIWDTRNRLFGKEAAERIWASELKNHAIADTLAALDAKQDANLQQKLETYKQRLHEIHGEQTEAYLERHRQETMNRFLDLSSVQRELTGMSPEARSQSLRAIRQGMGLDEEALKRWDALDQTRDMRWQSGAAYMAERESLAKQLSGPALEAKLQELRARFFGAEAEVIGQEEASGFFRYDRPRQWGRN
ncbi:lipase secretion chaperone [Hyalangium rubrum]|uniref:Lipase modulator n=1 Tax=Hyalangium rubrum TaxID=3103134 RepID=A0ABU5HFH8_9BACT|nr:hypothetical protein [Hyalangium sp. s54d21]MDY7232020.1 hypothetical protein [Hyalangium sp. s54d21]